ncbi:mechanosensitive ion channel protein 4-like [Bidens hawaiensis]|uniref:mechanosensitive ion channel protein 4-like n=1 Tax=Bidens hawaiensis TaxID=980011 RepID=UPI00404A40D9
MVFLFIIEAATVNILKFLSGVLVLISFIFGGVCKTTFEDLIFFFVVRPFYVRDQVEINGVQITVERMKILTTEFLRNDDKKIIYPNSMLPATSVLNSRYAPNIVEVIDFYIHKTTQGCRDERSSGKVIYVGNSPHWQAIPKLLVKDGLDQNQLGLSFCVSHSGLFQSDSEKSKKRDLLIETMRRIFAKLGINKFNTKCKAPITGPYSIPLAWTIVKEVYFNVFSFVIVADE